MLAKRVAGDPIGRTGRIALSQVASVVPAPGRAADAEAFWASSAVAAFAALGSGFDGLTADEARRRLDRLGENRPAAGGRLGAARALVAQFESPLILVLIAATVFSGLLGDVLDAAIILAIVVATEVLKARFYRRGQRDA